MSTQKAPLSSAGVLLWNCFFKIAAQTQSNWAWGGFVAMRETCSNINKAQISAERKLGKWSRQYRRGAKKEKNAIICHCGLWKSMAIKTEYICPAWTGTCSADWTLVCIAGPGDERTFCSKAKKESKPTVHRCQSASLESVCPAF